MPSNTGIDHGRIGSWRASVSTYRARLEDGSLQNRSVSASAAISTTDEYRLRLGWSSGDWQGLADASNSIWLNWLTRHLYGGGGVGWVVGKRNGRDYSYYRINQSLRPIQKFVLGLGFEWSRLGEPGAPETNQLYTVSGNYEITPEKRLGIWAVGRNNDVNLCLTFTQTVRSGADIYLIYGYPNTTETTNRWAMKVVYPVAL